MISPSFHHFGQQKSASELIERTVGGTLSRAELPVGTMASGQPITLPLVIAKGKTPGPVLWLNGAVHGDEINGTLAMLDFIQALDCETLAGTVIASPVSNPAGFDARRKRVPQDDQDLDQSFPGNAQGMLSQLLAHTLFEAIRTTADVVLNFHTMNPYFSSVPYAVYKDAGEGAPAEADLLAAISCFAPFVACKMSVSSGAELPGNNAGSLDYQSLRLGKLSFMVELGGGSRQEPQYVEAGVVGLQRLAAHLGMLPPLTPSTLPLRRVTGRTHVFNRHGGLFRQYVAAGTLLKAGEALGVVQDLTGTVIEKISFDQDVLVIGVRNDPVVHSGDRVGFVALKWEEVHGN